MAKTNRSRSRRSDHPGGSAAKVRQHTWRLQKRRLVVEVSKLEAQKNRLEDKKDKLQEAANQNQLPAETLLSGSSARISVAPNQYYGKDAPPTLSHYKLALTLNFSRSQEERARQFVQYINRAFSLEKTRLEDYSDEQAFHYLVFCRDLSTVECILREGLKGIDFYSNLDDQPINSHFLLGKAQEYSR